MAVPVAPPAARESTSAKTNFWRIGETRIFRKKRGFGAPFGAWLKRDLQPMMRRLLSKQAVESRGLFHWPMIEETIGLHMANREDHTDHLMALLNLEVWARIFLDRRAPEDLADELIAEVAVAG